MTLKKNTADIGLRFPERDDIIELPYMYDQLGLIFNPIYWKGHTDKMFDAFKTLPEDMQHAVQRAFDAKGIYRDIVMSGVVSDTAKRPDIRRRKKLM